MISADGWFDWMARDPGPADKVYSDPCTSEISVFHDAVGYYPGWMSRLKSTARDAQGRYTDYAAASVTGWLPYKAGIQPVQHYPINKSCWASGSRHLNTHGNAFEDEAAPIYTLPSGAWAFVGQAVPGDWHNPPPQSDWQVECAARIESDLAAFFGRPLTYWRRPTGPADLGATEYEHNETTRWGGLYSSCPNRRIRWADIATARLALQEEDDMPDQAYFDEQFKKILTALGYGVDFHPAAPGDPDPLDTLPRLLRRMRNDALRYADSTFPSVAQQMKELREHIDAKIAALPGGGQFPTAKEIADEIYKRMKD